MPKFRIWFSVIDNYSVEVESDSLDAAMDNIYENPPIDQRDSFVSSNVEIYHWEEVNG